MIFSVIIPTRNRYSNLKNTVESLRNQSLPKDQWELIVSDDNSTDETFNVYKENQDLHIKYVNNNTKPHTWNASIPRNLGALISNPSTEAFIFVDSDVKLPTQALEFFLEDYRANKNRVVIGSYDFTLQDGQPISYENGEKGDVRSKKFRESKPSDEYDTIHDGLACFGGNIMIPKKIFWQVGGFSPDIHIGLEDGDMGLKLWKVGTKFSYDDRTRGLHQWHEPPPDRFPADMRQHIDNLNLKHFNTVNPDYGIIEASRETYAKWGVSGWEPPKEWLTNKIDLSMKIK